MDILFFLLLLIFFIAFIIGIIKPSFLGLKSRGKVIIFTFLPNILFFLLWGYYNVEKDQEAINNPAEATELRFYNDNLTETPEILRGLSNLKKLNLEKNKIQLLDSTIVLSLINLEELNISNNPINQFPKWISKLKNLKTINISKTNIAEIDAEFLSNLKISFEETPFEIRQNNNSTNDGTKGKTSVSNPDSLETESFSEFAIRKLTGKEYGEKLEFKDCEVYYIKPVNKSQAQKFGDFMKTMGYFNDENEVSIQLKYNSTDQNYEIRFVVDENKLTNEIREAFKLIGTLASASIFNEKNVKVHLCNERLNTIEIL